ELRGHSRGAASAASGCGKQTSSGRCSGATRSSAHALYAVSPTMPRTFDWMARPYALLEHLVLGRRLQRTRLALLPELLQARSILVLGEGDGRFLSALMAQSPQAQVTVVGRSAGMVGRARRRLDAVGRRTSHRERMSLQPVSFLVQDARAWARTHHGSPFDAVVTL